MLLLQNLTSWSTFCKCPLSYESSVLTVPSFETSMTLEGACSPLPSVTSPSNQPSSSKSQKLQATFSVIRRSSTSACSLEGSQPCWAKNAPNFAAYCLGDPRVKAHLSVTDSCVSVASSERSRDLTNCLESGLCHYLSVSSSFWAVEAVQCLCAALPPLTSRELPALQGSSYFEEHSIVPPGPLGLSEGDCHQGSQLLWSFSLWYSEFVAPWDPVSDSGW